MAEQQGAGNKKLLAITSLDGDNGDWGRKMPNKRKILEDKKEDLDL